DIAFALESDPGLLCHSCVSCLPLITNCTPHIGGFHHNFLAPCPVDGIHRGTVRVVENSLDIYAFQVALFHEDVSVDHDELDIQPRADKDHPLRDQQPRIHPGAAKIQGDDVCLLAGFERSDLV